MERASPSWAPGPAPFRTWRSSRSRRPATGRSLPFPFSALSFSITIRPGQVPLPREEESGYFLASWNCILVRTLPKNLCGVCKFARLRVCVTIRLVFCMYEDVTTACDGSYGPLRSSFRVHLIRLRLYLFSP